MEKFKLIHAGIYSDHTKQYLNTIVYGKHWRDNTWNIYSSPNGKHIGNYQYGDGSYQLVKPNEDIPYKECIWNGKLYKYLTYYLHQFPNAILFDHSTLEYVDVVRMSKISINISDIDWSKSHCGVILCDYNKTSKLMPEVIPVINDLVMSNQLEYNINDYLIDVKVHMLMPGQFPCIPNWHCDFVPRDSDLNLQPDKVTGEKMYLWVSNGPYTEFEHKPFIIECEQTKWVEFDQTTRHRGTVSEEHTWRCFIRLIPKSFIEGRGIKNVGEVRRHCQVYLDSENFTW